MLVAEALIGAADVPANEAAAALGSGVAGKVLVSADFSSDEVDKKIFSRTSWNIPGTWELRDGVLACIYDSEKAPGKAHGKSIDPLFKAHDIRVSYRVRFDSDKANLVMIPNAGWPEKTGVPMWHMGSLNTRVATKPGGHDVSLGEVTFTRDINDPRVNKARVNPQGVFEKNGGYPLSGGSSHGHDGLQVGRWHQFVFESVGKRWRVWVDGKESRSLDLEHGDYEKESVNLIGHGPLLLDDLLIEDIGNR
ncbi:MAG: hypothetical protein WCC69_04060 [Pirellulales bacterium]